MSKSREGHSCGWEPSVGAQCPSDPPTVDGNADWCSHCGKQYRFLRKLKMELPFDPAILLLGIYPKKPKTLLRKNTCTPMFIAALFTVAKIWKQPKCPSADERIKKLWYIYTMGYSMVVEKKKILPFAPWMDLGIIMLSELSQSEKDKYHMIILICRI